MQCPRSATTWPCKDGGVGTIVWFGRTVWSARAEWSTPHGAAGPQGYWILGPMHKEATSAAPAPAPAPADQLLVPTYIQQTQPRGRENKSDPMHSAKGRRGDCLGPHHTTSEGRNVTGDGLAKDPPPPPGNPGSTALPRSHAPCLRPSSQSVCPKKMRPVQTPTNRHISAPRLRFTQGTPPAEGTAPEHDGPHVLHFEPGAAQVDVLNACLTTAAHLMETTLLRPREDVLGRFHRVLNLKGAAISPGSFCGSVRSDGSRFGLESVQEAVVTQDKIRRGGDGLDCPKVRGAWVPCVMSVGTSFLPPPLPLASGGGNAGYHLQTTGTHVT